MPLDRSHSVAATLAALIALVMALLCSACSGSGRPSRPDAPPAGEPWRWRVVTTMPKQAEVPVLASHSWLVAPSRADPGLAALYSRNSAGRPAAQVALIRPSPGFEVVDTLLTEQWLVRHEQEARAPTSPRDEPTQRVVVRRLDAGHGPGPPRRVDRLPGVPAPGLPPSYHLTGAHLVYPTQNASPPGSHCLADLDLTTEHARIVACTDRADQGIGDGQWGPGGVTFNRWSPEPAPGGCLSVARVADPAPAGQRGTTTAARREPEAVPARRRCRPYSGLSDRAFTIWGERVPHAPEEASFYATTTGQVVPLGTGDTGSEVLCGRPAMAYWLSWSGETPLVKRWRPGRSTEVVLHLDPRRWLGQYLLQCDDSAIRVLRAANGRDIHQLIEATIP